MKDQANLAVRIALAEAIREGYHSATKVGHPMWCNLDESKRAPWLAAADRALDDAKKATPAHGGDQPESATEFKARTLLEMCSKWSGSQKVEAGDIVEWFADFGVMRARGTAAGAAV